MQSELFTDLPENYSNLGKQIYNHSLQSVYSQFTFLYFSPSSTSPKKENGSNNTSINQDLDYIENYLHNYLKDSKLFTYQITNINQASASHNSNNNQNDNGSQLVNIIIVIEKKCLIIEKIDFSLIMRIIEKLREQQIAIINCSKDKKDEINEEINNFCLYFQRNVSNNDFIKKTIRSISGFLIRRFFYPTDFFKDPSFFIFNNAKEKEMKIKLKQILKKNEKNEFDQLNTIIIKNDENKEKMQEFREDDFIILRTVYSSENATFKLVIHIKNLYVFMMKVAIFSEKNNREIDFVNHYSHRCLTKCFGFVLKNGKIAGIIYEYLSNGSLDLFMKNHKEKINNLFVLMTITRIFQAIEYLHLNSFIHRDLKPLNILIDHDYIPYVSDFDRVRHFIKENEKVTLDFGSYLHSSPEQDKGDKITTATDIYSFGLILYFLHEKENMFSFTNEIIEKDKIRLIKKASDNIKYIHQKCVQFNQEDRLKINEIKPKIIEEINSFSNIEQYLIETTNNCIDSIIIQFFIESIFIQIKDQNQLKQIYQRINIFHDLFILKNNNNISSFFLKLGNLYYDGKEVEKDYLKAKEFYEKSAQQNNSYAYNKLGDLYYYGYGVDENFIKAKEYFEISAKLENYDAIYSIGKLYFFGYGVEKDYLIAKKYFEISSKQNNSSALNYLGVLYYRGYGVKKDYKIAIQYFEKSAKLGNQFAFVNLGNAYFNGYGVNKNYLKAKECYEIASKQNNSQAHFLLGEIYYYGYGVNQNYTNAIKYFKMSSKNNNSNALNFLGIIYYCGLDVPIDYKLAVHYFEKSIQLGNEYAYINLGNAYFNGKGVEKNILKAKECYEISASKNNPQALLLLAVLYYYGIDVKKDYAKAKKYFELSSNQIYSNSFNFLGEMYYYGLGVKQNYFIARDYFELSAKNNNAFGFFYLGNIYSNIFETDFDKAINYYLKSFKITYQKNILPGGGYNIYRYRSANDLGLIYLLISNDLNNAKYYISQSAYGEYPHGQNNLGLLYQFFLNELEKAEYMYERSSKNNFALANYNLGYMKEKQGKKEEAIKYYINASKQENYPLLFKKINQDDSRLVISKKFILCLANLKIVKYYLSISNYIESRKYFIKAFANLNLLFIYSPNIGLKLKRSVLLYSLFNLSNQHLFPKIQETVEDISKYKPKPSRTASEWEAYFEKKKESRQNESNSMNEKQSINNDFKDNIKNQQQTSSCSNLISNIRNKELNSNKKQNVNSSILQNIFTPAKNNDDEGMKIYKDPCLLFDLYMRNEKLISKFLDEIQSSIIAMEKVLYIFPYPILFGRICTKKASTSDSNNKNKNLLIDINEAFYDGFEIDLN